MPHSRSRLTLRREDKNDWERRVPLTPAHVAALIEDHDLDFDVERFSRRAFDDREYARLGARLVDDLEGAEVVLGIKEIPPKLFREHTVYLFFSHTTKGQAQNMPSLQRLLDLECTLLDYEQVVDERGRRLIFFGKHAGYAGMIDALWMLGRRFAARGLETPFHHVRLAHEYSGLDEATHHLSRLGERLREHGLPGELRPLVVGFTGSGNVSEGAQEIFDRWPTLEILPEELAELRVDLDRPRNVLFKVVFRREHRVRRKDGGAFDAAEFDAHPERYVNGMDRWLRYLTFLVHGSFWSPDHPRLVTRADLASIWADGAPRLEGIADISCDIGGGIEVTVRPTRPDDPCYVWDLDKGRPVDGFDGRGPAILAVDNLPCQLPAESSEHFGDGLARFAPALARCDWTVPFEDLRLPPELKRAILVHRGALTPGFAGLAASLAEHGSS